MHYLTPWHRYLDHALEADVDAFLETCERLRNENVNLHKLFRPQMALLKLRERSMKRKRRHH